MIVKAPIPMASATLALALASTAIAREPNAGRWPMEKAWRWYESQPWRVGFNYIPATAINTTEMWQAETFDPDTIGAELTLAHEVGFNCARVFVQYLVWESDAEGLEARLERFLSIADERSLRTLLVLFDDCAFGTMTEPFLGKQPEVNPGEFANAWTPSPGPKRVLDRTAWPKLEAYVRAVVGRFRDDPRVLGWDVYNEPGNNGMGDRSLPLVVAAFAWARQAGPLQPLTAAVWGGTPECGRACLDLSDVISVHCYGASPVLEGAIFSLRALGRPIFCTEWLNRPTGSLVETCLPVLARQRVGAFHWGLVNGKTQTHLPWGSRAGAPEPEVWQHDIFRKDLTPYDEKELVLFREATRSVAPDVAAVGQWPATRAWAWHARKPWLVGCNFLPSTAVNDVEMWRKETFDPKTIERELGWAQELGLNAVRVFLNYVAWREDGTGLKERFAEFLKIADRRGISVMPILFDDCNFAGRVASATPQPDPVPGVHNSQWVSSPPLEMVTDRSAWPSLERYAKDMVGAFGRDPRVVIWDLYNEPGMGLGARSQPLMEAAFAWARETEPIQPLTTGAWADFSEPLQRRMMELSDLVSFHGYDAVPGFEAKLRICATYGRPVLCTEWLVRRGGNSFERLLPMLRDRKVGCWSWGLVAGRTQTYFPWGSPPGAPEPKQWQHDILRADGTPFSAREVLFIQVTTGKLPASALPRRTALVPTAEKAPVPWRYVLVKPADDWFRADFDDADWMRGAAPFGTDEPPVARTPNTLWTGADIWLRRDFEIPAGKFTDHALLLHHDEDAEVYINGVLAAKADGYNAAYEPFDVSPEARAALRPRKNILAVHCRQTGGGQYIDVGIEATEAR